MNADPIKAYPLIYSRTKYDDFAPQFLTRPAGMEEDEVRDALRYVGNAMANLDTFQAIRYSTFATKNFCVCGGISCISRDLVSQLREEEQITEAEMETIQEFLKDCKGRKLAFFIGVAIPKSKVRSGRVPDISIKKYWETYLEYLKHQWNDSQTNAELIHEPIEFDGKTYSKRNEPEIEVIGSKAVIRNFSVHSQDILDYYYNRILNGEDVSFISEIHTRTELESLHFTDVSVTDELYRALKIAPVALKRAEQVENIIGTYVSNKTNSTSGMGIPDVKAIVKKTERDPDQSNSKPQDSKKKEKTAVESSEHFNPLPIILGMVLVIIVIIILIIAFTLKKRF